MRGADLRQRYEFSPGWDAETILELITQRLDWDGMLPDVVTRLDAIAEQEMETYAGFAQED